MVESLSGWNFLLPGWARRGRGRRGLLIGAAAFEEAGLHPRVAALHHALEVTRLSWETGGWIDGRALRYEVALSTVPEEAAAGQPDRDPR